MVGGSGGPKMPKKPAGSIIPLLPLSNATAGSSLTMFHHCGHLGGTPPSPRVHFA